MTAALHSSMLYNFCRQLQQCDVMVDPYGDETWAECLSNVPVDELPRVQLRHPIFDKNSPEAPWLIRVPLKHLEVLEKLGVRALEEAVDPTRQIRSVCGFIQSELPLERLARLLESQLTVKVGQRKVYFRYFDPRVMHHLPALLPPDRLALNALTAWGYFTWEGNWAEHAFAGIAKDQFQNRALSLTNEEWLPFAAIEHFNATVSAFKKAELLCPVSETDRLRRTVLATLALGISEPRDVACYLVRSRQWGRPVSQHPDWAVIQNLLRDGVPLADVLDESCPSGQQENTL